MGLGNVSKRILLGRKLRSSQLGETLLPKRIALPVFASDALSSVAYAPDEIFIMLWLAGASAYVWSLEGRAGRRRRDAHGGGVVPADRACLPLGGGDYEVATVNLGRNAGVTVAGALLVDYVLTVAVSISSASQYAAAAIPGARGVTRFWSRASLVVVLAAMNLRGVRESGSFFAVPTYLFIFAILGMCGLRPASSWPPGPCRTWPAPICSRSRRRARDEPLTTIGLMLLLARAFSSGCAALTGVEAISNGVPAFRKPKSRNAATTLLLLGH